MTAKRLWMTFAIAGLLSSGAASFEVRAEEKPSAKQIEFFEAKIRPVLVAQCYQCHSAEVKDGKPKGGLRLDTKEAALAGGESGPALVPGDPAESLILNAMRHKDLEMPPGKQLPDAVIADFEQWIRLGAADPRIAGQAVVKRTIDIEEGRKFWAFQPPKKTAPPNVKNASWAKTDVDRFVLAGLESHNLTPVADVDRRLLIRRVYFDLVGLPPTPQEIDAFMADNSPTALESVVDRLLASRQFAERWGRHWLDVARYAESNGNADNTVFAHAWRYRDYVIDSIDADKPFDRFLLEQVAGDLLPSRSPQEKNMLLVATGLLALGSKPRAQNNANFQMDVVAEQLEVTTTGFMGLTVACARCHDHKFDPIPTKEYYSLAGIFSSTETLFGSGVRGNKKDGSVGGGLHKLAGDPDVAIQRDQCDVKIADARREQSKLVAELKDLGAAVPAELYDEKAKQESNKKKKKNKNDKNAAPAEDRFDSIKAPADASDAVKEQVSSLARELASTVRRLRVLERERPAEEMAMGVREGKAADCAVCIRGESTDRGETSPRGYISVITNSSAPPIPESQSGRLQLAQWMASPQNPLTSRVIVNRIWKHLFGRGIVSTCDNFGALGERPSHPELLDNLALQFVEDGWSIKRMVRSLVLTRAYAMSSDHQARDYEFDPDNVYLWRHSPHRLDAESLRDSVLFVSGSLDPAPASGSGLAKYEGVDLKKGRLDFQKLTDAQGQHRSVYLPIVRNRMPEALDLFDVADPSLVTGSRDVTTVPSQSLYLLNSAFIVSQSRLFAGRLLAADGLDDSLRLDLAFRMALARKPTDDERARSLDLLVQARRAFSDADRKNQDSDIEPRAWATVTQAILAAAEFRYVE